MPHLRLASRGAKLSRCEKCWKRRVVEHSVLASTIVSLEFLNLSSTRIRFGRFFVCGPRTPFLPITFWADLTRVRKASRIPGWLRTFVSGTYGFGGVRVKPFLALAILVERRARLSLDSSYVDYV